MTSETRRGKAPGRLAQSATAAIGASVLLTIVIGLLGPSVMVPALSGPTWQPPYSLNAHPAPHLVVGLGAAAIVLGALGSLGLLLALSRASTLPTTPLAATSPPATGGYTLFGGSQWLFGGGQWLPDPRLLVRLGCLAAALLAFLPPSGSGDHLNYAAYGRMVTLGVNPYTHGAVDLPTDPIARAVEAPWREEPSVYGPVATAVQALASWIGGDSLRLTIFVLALVNAAAFIATGLLIDRFTRDDPARRLRAALLWTANPLLLYQLVAGMHIDTLAIACMVAALLARSRPVGSGLLLGLGVAVKINAGLVALGPAWELRRRPARLALMAGTALAVVVVGYVIVGSAAIGPMTRTSKSISLASFWKLVQGWLQSIVGAGSAYRGEIQIGSLLVLALVAWSLFRLRSRLDGYPGSVPVQGAAGLSAPVVAAVIVIAYLFATPYILPWYDGLAFGMLALIGASALDGLLLTHLLVLSLAYLPARVLDNDVMPPDLDWLRTVVRSRIAPWALFALTAALMWWSWRAAARVRTPRASTAPPP
ncbi:polyprenol phosphomannose-dependent alpha 1,6 mannosyltransferase MptB [Nonomuraea aurantiaca]|uniref:polyprenol phosphomannose-dependent alpha 1,6 mannosyltransferase MptB n=1 Tax=Nonomuraea aurantiaca TaxID=2878562 RepID=UPI001CD945CA|nr:polyprenol phosphomannose-dependent alpha 1,6 mannosyltransferase MptB [Nonomuraea aurantiaca]MCA2228665.1 polyprenol phosphomannose-dependent alpha 1,6 mannosyltransferase MptB [Nonomuraea aurantiaca]